MSARFVKVYDSYGNSHILNLAEISRVFSDRAIEVIMKDGARIGLRSDQRKALEDALFDVALTEDLK